MNRILSGAAVCMVLGVAVVRADAEDTSATYKHCIASTSINPEWAACGEAEVARQETRLNAAWKRALACFDEGDPTARDAKKSLVDEEKLWIAWKDAACGFYYPRGNDAAPNGFAGREGEVLSAPQCKIAIVSERAHWLENFGKDCR